MHFKVLLFRVQASSVKKLFSITKLNMISSLIIENRTVIFRNYRKKSTEHASSLAVFPERSFKNFSIAYNENTV